MRNWLWGAVIAGGAMFTVHAYAQDVVRIGTEADYPPFEYTAASGQLKGMEIELGNQYCAVAKIQCKWVNMSFDAMIAALNAHKIDAVLSQMEATGCALDAAVGEAVASGSAVSASSRCSGVISGLPPARASSAAAASASRARIVN